MSKKVFVKVIVECTPDGKMIPQRIIWPDGRQYDIDRILEVGPGVSPSGGMGDVYKCRIRGKVVPLYFGIGRTGKEMAWWMDGK